jgi:hypothetical protein
MPAEKPASTAFVGMHGQIKQLKGKYAKKLTTESFRSKGLFLW